MSKKLVVPSEVYSRVSGYFRPVEQWNCGKREEFSNRKFIDSHSSAVTERCEPVDLAESYLIG